MSKNDQFITISEAATILGVTTTTLRNWGKLNKISSTRDPLNGYRLYSLSEISSLLPQTPNMFSESSAPSVDSKNTNRKGEAVDARDLRFIIRQMSKAFRDSQGGSLLERFEEISKLLYSKMYDERNSKLKEFYIDNNESKENAYDRIASLYKNAIELLPQDIISGRNSLSDDKQATVKIVELLQNIEINNISSDVKGVVYEELIKNTFDKTENQQFFTPRTVVRFMADFTNPTQDQIILDPACGSGGFLIEASNHISKQQSNKKSKGKLVGLEIDKRMAWITQMNLLMHGDGDGKVHHLSDGGSLAYSKELDNIMPNESVDLILTNPPFGSDFTDIKFLSKYKLGVGKKSRRRGVLFIERCINWLKEGGKVALIIDDSVLNSPSNSDVRSFILKNTTIEAIISLPEVTFMPYATAKASIIILRKKGAKINREQKAIFMASAENVGRKPNGDPLYSNEMDNKGELKLINDLPEILDAWENYLIGGEDSIRHLSPRIFICPPEQLLNFEGTDRRLDIQTYHPARSVAEETINKAIYPTPKLLELISLRNASSVPNIQDPDDIWRYIGLANIAPRTGEYIITETSGNQLKSSVKLFKAGDILFSKLRPELRKCVLIDQNQDEGYVSSECMVLTINTEANKSTNWEINSEYLALILRSDIVFGQLIYQITGVGRPRVNTSTILNLKIPLPPIEVQNQIVSAYKISSQQYSDYKKRSVDALEQGENTIKQMYEFTMKIICP